MIAISKTQVYVHNAVRRYSPVPQSFARLFVSFLIQTKGLTILDKTVRNIHFFIVNACRRMHHGRSNAILRNESSISEV